MMWAALAVLAFAWAIATPLGGSPDEPAHIVRAASVWQGQILGEHTKDAPVTRVDVPRAVANAQDWPCFAFKVGTPASCQKPFHSGLQLEKADTSAGLYDPLYYAIVGWPSLFIGNAQSAVIAMRMIGALLSTGLLALAFSFICRMRGSRIISAGFLVAATPMVFFLASAVNPNALEFCGGLAFFVIAMYIVRDIGGLPSWPTLSGLMISGALFANARSVSPFWLALLGVIAIVYAPHGRVLALLRMRRFQVALAVVVVWTLASVVWTLVTGTLTSLGHFAGAGTASPIGTFVAMLVGTPFDPGWVGVFGWMETGAPNFVLITWYAMIFGAVIAALVIARGRTLAALVIGVAALFIAPALLQAASVRTSGYIWQGRYALVAFMCLAVLCGIVLSDKLANSDVGIRPLVTIACFTTVGQMWAFVATLARYTVGVDDLRAIIKPAQWAPPGGVVLSLVLVAVGAVGVAFVAILHAHRQRTRSPISEHEENLATVV